MRIRLPAILVALGIMGMATGLAAKGEPDKIVIKSCAKKKAPVKFDHKKHAKTLKIKCVECHHNKDAKNRKCSTADCHAGKAKGKKPGCAEMSLKKNPYHINCVGCHKKQKKGPKKCKECHAK